MTSETRESGYGNVALSVRGSQDAQGVLLSQDHAALSALLIQMLGEGKGVVEGDGYAIEAELIAPFETEDGQEYTEESGIYNLQVSEWPFADGTAPSPVFVSAEEGVWKSIDEYSVPMSDGDDGEAAPAEAPKKEEPKKEEPPKEEPKKEAKAEAASAEPAKSDDEPRKEEPKKEESKQEEPKQESGSPEPAKEDEPKKDEPKQEESKQEESQESATSESDGNKPRSGIEESADEPAKTDSGSEKESDRASDSTPEAEGQQPADEQVEVEPDPTQKPEAEKPAKETPSVQVQFVDFDGFILAEKEIPSGQSVSRPKKDPEHQGMLFAHWYDTRDGEGTPFSFDKAIKKNITIKAHYNMLEASADAEEEDPEQQEEPIDERLADLKVRVDTVYRNNMKLGDPVTLEGTVENVPEDMNARYQWQNNRNGAYEDIPGATDLSYTFKSSAENLKWKWRLQVALDSSGSSRN